MRKNIVSLMFVGCLMIMPMVSNSVYAKTAVNESQSQNQLEAVKNLNHLLSNLKNMTANFHQTTESAKNHKKSLANANQSFSGTMAMQRPNQFRWHIKGHAEQLIVANGNTLWVYDKDLEQVTRQKVDAKVGDTPALLLSGDLNTIAKNFTVTQPDRKKNYYVLYPKNGTGSFQSLAISFNSGHPVMMVLKDNLGQTSSIKFSGVKSNLKIADDQFHFTPPKGVDVIDQ